MDKLPQYFDLLSEHDKSFVRSFIYLRANHLCLSCHQPENEKDLANHNGFCIDCYCSQPILEHEIYTDVRL
jgi:hypothetical protein